MAEKKGKSKKSSTKRFGPRYGRRLKDKVAEIESGYRKKQKCPYCGKINVKREALGIWLCRSCKSKFTGRAYSIGKKAFPKMAKGVSLEETKPEPKEEDEDIEEEETQEVKNG